MLYYFTLSSGTRVQVCERFFLSTLDISKRAIHYNLSKSTHGVRHPSSRPSPSNKIPEPAREKVRAHIRSINTVESHYCRSETKRLYFEAGLTLPKVFEMFKTSEFFDAQIKESFYRAIFTGEFNIGFHQPMKDQCDMCDAVKKAGDLTEEDEAKHAAHLTRARQALSNKEEDKKVIPGLKTITFDLQQVLTAPRLFVGVSLTATI